MTALKHKSELLNFPLTVFVGFGASLSLILPIPVQYQYQYQIANADYFNEIMFDTQRYILFNAHE